MKSKCGCRFLVAIALAVAVIVDVEARSLKTFHRGLEHRGQWETLNGVHASMPASHRWGKSDETDVFQDSSDAAHDDIGDDETETADAVDKEAAVEEEEDDKELEGEQNETKPEKKKAGGASSDESEKEDKEDKKQDAPAPSERKSVKQDAPVDPESVYGPSTTPPPEPFPYMFTEADAVARDAELRRGMEFHPQGSKSNIDVTKQEQFKVDSFFSQDPSIFGHCVLIRDFAEPLRVGSALMEKRSTLRGGNEHRHHRKHPKAPSHGEPKTWHAKSSIAALHKAPDRFVSAFAHSHRGQKNKTVDEKKLPDEVMLVKGGVVDRDVGESKSGTEDVELEVNMFAFLRSVAGEVAVIPNGDIAKWSSKKKVPIAGYLCTSDQGPVLHTLPTPCLPTSIDSNGQPFSPPAGPPPPVQSMPHVDPTAPPGVQRPEHKAPAPAADPTKAPKPVVLKVEDSDAALEAEAEAEAQAAEAIANGPTAESFLERARRSGPAPAPAAGSGPAPSAPPLQPVYSPYHVWVGSSLLEFRSKPKAERFCKRLTKRIAEDLGDEEWDADRLLAEDINKKDMSVANFMALARKPAPEWTTGTKTVLVVVMDWKRGDNSRAPYTKQTLTPRHYKDKIFPRVRQAFQRMSYGKFDMSVTVVPEVVRFTKPRSRYTAGGYPFPGLYNGAKDSIEGTSRLGSQYKFGNFDLVYVISPQQAPTGTKGVAWVGAKGAMCNGCEEISENFQVMVAVHELGHNLGLWHASSKSLEYGNVFDWMGNYPDVTGLSYGLGYKLRLNWLPQTSIAKITDSDLGSLNDEYYIMPFDSAAAPMVGQLTGVQVDLKGNRRALYLSYRQEPGTGKAGLFLTMQDRDKPNSELIDCACHSPSQQDAALQQGWTYIDPTSQVVIHAYKIEANLATVRIFKAPSSSKVASIKARSGFTDGQWKCPRVCTDSDLLVSQYKGCAMLARDGYCQGGSIKMGGTKFSIGGDLCPKSCDQCAAANKGGSLTDTGCADKNVKISGMTCGQAAGKGYCDYSTNIGHIGDDLCPRSCDRCPAKPAAPSSSSTGFTDPTPVRVHGVARQDESAPKTPQIDTTKEEKDKAKADEEAAEEASADDAENEEAKEEDNEEACTDDAVWTDADNDGCATYADYIKQGKLSLDEACNYGSGESKHYCRKTCNTCEAKTSTCEDKLCVTRWRRERGKCFACNEWKSSCHLAHFRHDCPRTCGTCKSEHPDTTPPLPSTPMPPTTTVSSTMPPTEPPTAPPPCKDEQCVGSWLKSFGTCHKCADFAEDYCGRDELFMKSCPKSCKICMDGEVACHDNFLPHTCKRYVSWGWCAHAHIADHCKASCGFCAAALDTAQETEGPKFDSPFQGGATRHASFSLGAAVFVGLSSILAVAM